MLVIVVILLSGCGYRPSSKYAREVLGNSITTDIVISSQDPANTVIIKDAVDASLVEVFHARLTSSKYADTHLSIVLNSPSYSPIQYDTNGFVIAYRTVVGLSITRETKDIRKTYAVSGTYDFSVSPNSVLTDQERFDAIKFASAKAISSFIAQVSAEGSTIK